MKLHLLSCVLVLILTSVLAENAEEIANKDQDEDEEYDDIAVAESQDIAHSNKNLSETDEDHLVDRPRSRPRGRKRRRRLRKRPRSTTPSFIEEYGLEKSVKEEGLPLPVNPEVLYQRRRPAKRRRRPMMQLSEYDINIPEIEVTPETLDEQSYQEYHRPRNNQRRRRRKGGRKRIHTTTESQIEFKNTYKVDDQEVTTQSPEVVMQTNNYTYELQTLNKSPSSSHDETTTATLPSSFTTKEITEINHKLESLSKSAQTPELEYQVSGLGAFSLFQPTASTTQHVENNQIVSLSTTPRDYSWVNRFEPKTASTTSEVFHKQTFNLHNAESERLPKPIHQNIKNIEKIIENRKNLFSKSRRLPLTSALIRRRLQPKKHQISTTQETFIDNKIPSITQSDSKLERTTCHSIECALNKTSILTNSIVPNDLLPSGFPTMPEILSTAELIQQIIQRTKKDEQNSTIETILNNNETQSNGNSNVIIITPSTLIRPHGDEEIGPIEQKNKNNMLVTLRHVNEESERKSDIELNNSTQQPKLEINEVHYLSPLIEPIKKSLAITKAGLARNEPEHDTVKNMKSSMAITVENDQTTTKQDLTPESDKLKLGDVDTSNINDEILELLMDEMGKARVKRILELRNMTLSELIAHRERGAGHFSLFSDDKNSNITKPKGAEIKSIIIERKMSIEEAESDDEEQTEKMIVEKAKHIISKIKKKEEVKSSINKTSEGHNFNFGKKIKVEGTVIPVPILESTHSSSIQFPDDSVLGAFPKYMYDITGTNRQVKPFINENPVFREPLNKPRDLQIQREPRVFESMPKFNSDISNKENLEMLPYPDWRITVPKTSTEKNVGFPGISREIMLVASTTTKYRELGDVFLLDEGEEVHNLRTRIIGRNINTESQDIPDEDYSEEKKVPAGVKSAIAASGALLLLAIFGFLAVLVSCKIRQRRARLRVRRDILNEHLAEDFRSSQRSLTPVLRKSPFNIHSNTASNRHYYLWRTLRKTFQYE